jgi:hypothetical protein
MVATLVPDKRYKILSPSALFLSLTTYAPRNYYEMVSRLRMSAFWSSCLENAQCHGHFDVL